MFSPLAFPKGQIILDISTTPVSDSQADLFPFEAHRVQLMIIGIADGSHCCLHSAPQDASAVRHHDRRPPVADQHQHLSQSLEKLRREYSKALVSHVLVFDHPSMAGVFPEYATGVPTLENSTSTTIKTLLCDLTAQMLAEMTGLAKSLQALPSMETWVTPQSQPAASQQPTSGARPVSVAVDRSLNDSADFDARAQSRMSMPPHHALSDLRSSTSQASTPPRTATPPIHRSSEDGGRGTSKSRDSIHGFGANSSGEKERVRNKARVGISVGALYLLAGRWPDALKELCENAITLRVQNDYVWLAKALDYILVTTIMYAWAGLDFRVCERQGTHSQPAHLFHRFRRSYIMVSTVQDLVPTNQ